MPNLDKIDFWRSQNAVEDDCSAVRLREQVMLTIEPVVQPGGSKSDGNSIKCACEPIKTAICGRSPSVEYPAAVW